jgi:tetratricopeptide (TPR) repeat protein
LALQCEAAVRKAGYIGKEANAGYRLCEQALDTDPNNLLALDWLAVKFWLPVGLSFSADPKADLKRADELASQAIAVDPNDWGSHGNKANILSIQGRFEESIAESERTLALDPTDVDIIATQAVNYLGLGQFQKSLEIWERAIRLSPLDPALFIWYGAKSSAYFWLKQYDQAIDWGRRSIAINPNYNPGAQGSLIAALGLTGHQEEAGEALQRFLALPSSGQLRTTAAWKAYDEARSGEHIDPRVLETNDRRIEGLRKAGMPEE